MKQKLFYAGLLYCIGLLACSIAFDGVAQIARPYEAYSWQDSNNRWVFALVGSPSGVYTQIDNVFASKLMGLDDFEMAILKLPPGSTIAWNGPARGAPKKLAKLKKPPGEIINEIEKYAQKHSIHLGPYPP